MRIASDPASPVLGSFMTHKPRLSAGARGSTSLMDDRANDDSEQALSVMKRLYDEVTMSDGAPAPTLKNYRLISWLR